MSILNHRELKNAGWFIGGFVGGCVTTFAVILYTIFLGR